jgi:murein DD-endopeptidase MepM/ murein hydrolase activator NlpD
VAVVQVRASQARLLAGAQAQTVSLSGRLRRLEAAQRVAAQSLPVSGGEAPSTPSTPTAPSAGAPPSGGFEFPMPKGDVAPPSTWTLGDGVGIAAPGGTPELAVCAGTIVQHGIGGSGPSAPVIHCDHPLGGYDDVYYGHAGSGDWTPIGTHVSRGEVITEVGYGIVGMSSGPHLEIGFADAGGTPVGPSSAPAMMSLLRAAYRR